MDRDVFAGTDGPLVDLTKSFEGNEAGGGYLHQGLVFSRANGVGAAATDVFDLKVLRRAAYSGGVSGFANAALDVATEVGEDAGACEVNARMTTVNKGPVGTESLAACIHARKDVRSDGFETGHTGGLLVGTEDLTQDAKDGAVVTAEFGITSNGADPNYSRALLQLMSKRGETDEGVTEVGAGIFFGSDGNSIIRKAISFGHPRGQEVAPTTFSVGIDFTTGNFTGPTLIQSQGQLMALEATASIQFGIAALDEVVGIYRLGREVVGFDASNSQIRIDGLTVLSKRQPALPDTLGATLSALEAELNKLKSMLREHGLIAH